MEWLPLPLMQIGQYNTLPVKKTVDFGLYLDADGEEILLPKRFVPADAQEGDMLEVFLYHDSENRVIATTQKPLGVVGEIVLLKCVSATDQGAFLDWGLMKDIFVPKSQQVARMYEGQSYLVLIYIDEKTGRTAGTEKFTSHLDNRQITVKENDPVQLTVWQKTDIGYKVIINNRHYGVLHFSDIFRELEYGEHLEGFVKAVRPEKDAPEKYEIDVMAGERGYKKVLGEKERILQLLQEHNNYLPYNDKSDPQEIYDFFGMSKKVFKMTLGALYKERVIEFTQTGIKKLD